LVSAFKAASLLYLYLSLFNGSCWRWGSIYLGVDVSNQMLWLDKWHLGPLRILNFFAASWLISKFLKRLECWETPLRPLLLIGQHILPVFCCQICLSILLIGMVGPLKDQEPIASVLVVCQLVSAFLLAWLLECISRRKNLPSCRRVRLRLTQRFQRQKVESEVTH
jgi:hypothetical protein